MRKRFHKVNIEISNVCNLQCSFCPPVERNKKLIDIELFRKVVRQVAPLTELVCFHLMGDPLVHPHLEELVDICHEENVKIFFVTNGVLMREKQSELLLHPAFHQVNFSLHSFNDNFPDRDPSDYLEKIFRYTERALNERPELYLNFRLWNLDEPRGETHKNFDMLKRIEERFGVPVDRQVDVRSKKSIPLRGRLYLHFDTEFVWPGMERDVLGVSGTCYGLTSHFGVLADGTVVPCCLDKEGAIPLGRVQDSSVTEILANPRSQAMLKGFRENRLVEELCKRCQYIERFQ